MLKVIFHFKSRKMPRLSLCNTYPQVVVVVPMAWVVYGCDKYEVVNVSEALVANNKL